MKLAFGLTLLVLILIYYMANDNRTQEYILGNSKLCVPVNRLLEPGIFSWLYIGSTLKSEDRKTISVEFSAEELSDEIDGYVASEKKIINNIGVLITYLSENEIIRTMRNSTFSQLWLGKGPYKNRVYEYDEGFGLYKVYGVEKSNSWSFFSREPSPEIEVPENVFDYLVASCYYSHRKFDDGYRLMPCMSDFVMDNLRVRVNYSGVNTQYLGDIKEFIRKKINYWKLCDRKNT